MGKFEEEDVRKAADAMARARRIMRLFRSNLREGFPQHATWHLMTACREVGEAQQLSWGLGRSCGDLTSKTLEHARNRLMDYFKVPHAPNPFDR